MNWIKLTGVILSILGIIFIVYNEIFVNGVIGRNLTGVIFFVLGALIVFFKRKNLHYSFLITARV